MPGHLIRRAHQVSSALFAEECGEFGLTSVQFAALVTIEQNPGIDATRLSGIIDFDRSTIGDVLERIEGKRWIVRAPSSGDRRIKILEISPDGIALLAAVQPGVRRVQQRLLEVLAPADRETVVKLLGQLAKVDSALPHETPQHGAAIGASLGAAYEDYALGQQFRSRSIVVDADSIIRFAEEYDPQPQHLSEAGARSSQFGELVASGWHTAALSMRLFVEVLPPAPGGLRGAGIEDLAWPTPVRSGDELHVAVEVVGKRESRSRPANGLIQLRVTTCNQRGEVVQFATHTVVVRRLGSAEPVVSRATGNRK